MERFAKALGAIVAVATVGVGCASIINGTNQDVGISSSPSGLQVTVDNVPQGTTPVVAKLSRRESHLVKIEMDGYQPFEATLTRGVSGWVWGNIVFGGLIGLAVDAISGGMFKLTPEQITGTLAQKNMAHFQADGELYIVVVLDADPQWERIGTLNRAQ